LGKVGSKRRGRPRVGEAKQKGDPEKEKNIT